MRMRGPLSGANMTSNSVGLLFYSVLSTFLPAKVIMFDILILLRMKDMMDTTDMLDLMDMIDPLLPIKFLSVAFAAHYLLVCALLVFLPESPQWLVKSTSFAIFFMFKVRHQRIEGARASLRRLRGADYPGVELELQEIQKCCEQETSQVKNSVFEEVKSRTFVLPMAIFTLIFALLGCTGNDTMVFLGPAIFSKAS